MNEIEQICIRPDLKPSTCYSEFKCKCPRCKAWNHSLYLSRKGYMKACMRRSYLKNKEAHKTRGRKTHLKKFFGLTPEDYVALFNKQQGQCLICDTVNNNGRNLSVDHNHKTGKIRGLLCTVCNSALGKFKDSKEMLLKAISYLEKYD